jgi:two-component system nitrogen regulation sensor histidine kinase NtrY
MVFKNFYIQIAIRLLILTGLLLLLSLCIVNDLYLRSIYMAVFAAASVVELFLFINRFTKHIQLFLVNIRQRDFTFHFSETKDKFQELYQELNHITAAFQKINSEKQVQYRFIQTMLDHINVGIISFDDNGDIHLSNNAFLRLVGKIHLSTVSQLETIHPVFVNAITELKPEETKVVKFHKQNQIHNLALFAASFKVENKHFKLVSMQDITNELNLNELEAWQKLIRVLTHEIMNSIAPIVSLSDTLHTMVEKESPENKAPKVFETLKSGLEAIKVRSEGLQIFTDAYRQLTRIPNPEFSSVNMSSFFDSIRALVLPEISKRNISFRINVNASSAFMDRKLIEQVILNLLWNAIDAIGQAQHPEITVTASGQGEKVKITIADNGTGIEEANLEKIFIPFFTTKKNGSGIGLAVSRQIVQMHKGELQVASSPNTGTTFTILL